MIITPQRFLLWFMGIFLLVYYFGYHDTTTRMESSRPIGDIVWNDEQKYDPTDSNDFLIQLPQHLDSKRDTPSDNLKQLLETSSTIVRVANAIHLQIELMNRSISVNTAAEELLNLGNVTVTDLTYFKSENVSALAQKLKEKPIPSDENLVNWEDKVIKLNDIRIRSEQIGDLDDETERDEYFTSLKNYNTTLDLTTVNEAFNSLDTISKNLIEIESLEISEGTDPLLKKQAHGRLFSYLQFEIAEKMLKEVKNVMSSRSTEINHLASTPQILSSIGLLIELSVKRHKFTARSDSELADKEKKNFEQLDDFKIAFQRSKGDLAKFSSLAKTRDSINGVSDNQQLEKRIQSYLEPMTSKKVPLETLRTSLAPYFKLEERLLNIDKMLQPIGGISASLEFWKSLEEDLEKQPSSEIDLTDYFDRVDKCHLSYIMAESHYTTSQTLIKEIGEVGKMFTDLSSIINNMDVEKHKKEMDDFIKFLGFTDITDQTKSPDEVPAVLKRVKGSQELKKFSEIISEIKKGLDMKKLDGMVRGIISNKSNLVTSQMKDEAEVYSCFQKFNNEFEEVVPKIIAVQKLRKLDQKRIEDLETAISAVSDTSKGIGNLKDIPEIMKKENPEFLGKMNSLPSPASLNAMAVCVNSLQSAFELKTLKSSIPQLKSIGLVVDNEIRNIKTPETRKTLQDEWGNHTNDLSSLENAVSEIEDFEKNLNPAAIKTIADYGAVFQKLGNLSDVKINSESKIQALNSLISNSKDSKIKSDLEKNRKILEQIAPLDLDFSSHKSFFDLAPKSFGSFQQFLIDFSTILQPPLNKNLGKPTVIYVTDPSVKKKKDDNGLYFGIGGSVIFLALVCISLFLLYKFWWKRRKRQPVIDKKAIENWIKKQMFTREKELKYCDAYRVHEAFMISMEIQAGQADKAASRRYLPESKQRGDKHCNPATALHHLKKDGKKMPIHANLITTPEGKKFIATQAPMKKRKRKDDTREDFWHMVMHEGVENIVMLCTVEELLKDEVYYGVDGDTTLQFGRYIVKTVKAQAWKKTFERTVGYRQIEVTDTTKTYPTRLINHYHFIDWKDMRFPKCGNAEEVYHILKEVTKSNAPTVVNCLAGIGRTMTFIGLQFAAEAVKLNQNVTMVEVLTQLREARWYAVQTIRQSYWLQTAVCYKLNEDYKLGMDAQIEEILETFQQVAEKHRGPPEFVTKREKNKGLKNAGESQDIYCPPKTDKDFGVYIQY